MTTVSSYPPIITLNVNGLNPSIKRYAVSGWLKKISKNMLPMRNSFSFKGYTWAENKGMEKMLHVSGNLKRMGMGILNSGKIEFQLKLAHHRQRRSLYNDDGVSSSTGNRNCKYVCMQDWRTQIFKTNITGTEGRIRQQYNNSRGLHIPLSMMDRPGRQKISEEVEGLNNSIDQMGLIDIYGTSHSVAQEKISKARGTFSRMDDMLGHILRRLKSYRVSFPTTIVLN